MTTLAGLRKAILALRAVFWGHIIGIMDGFPALHVYPHMARVAGVIGFVMVTFGIWQLRSIRIHTRYVNAMTCVLAAFALQLTWAIAGFFMSELPWVLSSVWSMLFWMSLLVFCQTMRWLCDEWQLRRESASWRMTLVLLVFLSGIVLVQIILPHVSSTATMPSVPDNLVEYVAVVEGVVLVMPIVHLFFSINRMTQAAKARAKAEAAQSSTPHAVQ